MSSGLQWIRLISYEVDKIQRKINSMKNNKTVFKKHSSVLSWCCFYCFAAPVRHKNKNDGNSKSQLVTSRKRTTEVKLIRQSLIFTVNHCCYVATGSQPSSSFSLHTSAARHLPPLPNIDLLSIPGCTTVKLQQILLNLSNKSVWRSLNCKAVVKDRFLTATLEETWKKICGCIICCFSSIIV